MIIFAADDPLVLNGTYDVDGYTPKERRALERRERAAPHTQNVTPDAQRKGTMRLFDDDKVGCYLDAIRHRLVKQKNGDEVKMIDLTLRVQPFTPGLAVALDPDVRALLFSLGDATPKPKLAAVHFALTVPRQQLHIGLLPEMAEQIVLCDCDISRVRVRTEKGVDGFGLVFYVSYGPPSARELEYVCDWHTQQRFVTFNPQQRALALEPAAAPAETPPEPPAAPRRRGRPPIVAGDTLRPGVDAQH